MPQTRMTIIIYIIAWLVIVYISLLAFMYLFQRNLIFRPFGTPFESAHAPYVPWSYETDYGLKLRGLWYPPMEGKPTLVFFQGNGAHIGNRLFKMVHFQSKGFGIAMVGYRGYNGNPGKPTEQGLYSDARTAIKSLQEKGVKTSDIILYGESLGSGVATQMAVEHPDIKALILEAPYTSVTDVAAKLYPFFPVRLVMHDRFDSLSRIADIHAPLLVIHGTHDRLIPYEFGVRLFEKSQSPMKRLMSVDSGLHHDLYNYQTVPQGVHEFIHAIK